MKKSNLFLIVLSIFLLAGLFVTDRLLVIQYKKINFKDPYKNFQSIAIKPFSKLSIRGGNGYAIRIIQGDHCEIKLMNSRKDFFKMERTGDNVMIKFTVAGQNYQRPEEATVGLIITMPALNSLQLSGTNNEIGPFLQDSLVITQDKNTYTRIKQLQVHFLKLSGMGTSYFDLLRSNDVRCLTIHMKNTSVVNFHEVRFKQFYPVLKDSAAVVFYSESLDNLRRTQ
jgi:hypothetical protein